jgi:sec-independent protein translocase protein TatA
MGLGGISVSSLLIILAIVILLFGTKRIRQLGGDVGGFLKGLKSGIEDFKESADEVKRVKKEVEKL